MGHCTFVVPSLESNTDQIHHIAIQAAAMVLKEWMKELEPEPEEARAMAEAIVTGLMGRKPR